MYYKDICDKVAELIVSFETRDPYVILNGKDIDVLYESLGRKKKSIKGFFYAYEGAMAVTINSDLSEILQRIIAAHELGHALLHGNADVWFFHEHTYLDESSILEKEANLFAAELLISDDDVLENIREGSTLYSAASNLCVPVELLIFKIKLMNLAKDYNLPEPSLTAKNNFLFGMEVV